MEVTQELVAEWKETYGKLFKTNAAGRDVFYRTLTRDDYIQIAQDQIIAQTERSPFDPELATFRTCVLNEVDFSDSDLKLMGGIVSSVYEQIMSKSGFIVAESEEL